MKLVEMIRLDVENCTDGSCRIEALNRFFFNALKFRPEGEITAEGLLPSSVLMRRTGHCVGLVTLYLIASDALALPVAAVAAPGHLFLRYDDGETTLNIDPLRAGRHFEDAWYAREYKIAATSSERGVFLRSLTEREVLAYVYVNLGMMYSQIGDLGNASLLYHAALKQHPPLPSAHYNLGLDLMQQGRNREALSSLARGIELHPTDPWALYARGLAFCALGKTRRATRELRKAIALDDGFQIAREKLANLTCIEGKRRRHR